mgnify:CR=1 FL=1
MKVVKSILTVAVVASMFSCANQAQEVSSLETEIDSASYALGLDMALKVKTNFKEADTDLFLQGYRNGMDSTNLLIKSKDLNAFLRTFFQKQQAAKMKEKQEKAAKIALEKFGENKKAGEDFGEMIFTHFGLSGPIILTLSRIVVEELDRKSKVEITIDLKPALDEQKLDNRLIRDLNEHGKKRFINILKYWLPSTMIPVFIDILKLDPNKECHQVSSKERKHIRHLLKNLPFTITNNRSFKEAIITSGGIPTKEIYSKTMESKIVSGLYFAGEVIDVDAETGGYNLQIAYSTGWLAGDSSVVV